MGCSGRFVLVFNCFFSFLNCKIKDVLYFALDTFIYSKKANCANYTYLCEGNFSNWKYLTFIQIPLV